MDTVERTDITLTDIKPAIGSTVQATKAQLLSGDHADRLREALGQRGVLVFPRIGFTDEEHIAFTATLGAVATEPGAGELYNITLDTVANATAEYLKGAFYWHFDGYSSDVPIKASLLASKVLSPAGTGKTEFANTYAAYEALSDAEKTVVDSRLAVHSLAASMLCVQPQPSYQQWREWKLAGRKELPLVWKHASGRRSLVIGSSAHSVIGMDPLEGADLLIRLRDLATQPDFTYSHEWQLGDLVMWDNTGTLHRVTDYPLGSGRLLRRTKLQGEESMA